MAVFFHSAHAQDIENLKDQKPFTFHGTMGLNLIGYGVNGIPGRQNPLSVIFSANATASLYGIEFPFSIVISDKQKNYSQPFNQFGLSPHWKWITLHGGYRNITFSNYTLAGYTFLGGGIELNPGLFRFGFIYGRFDRRTSESPLFDTDSLPHFTRRGFAAKLGVGNENNFFDLIYLRIRDDSASLQQPDTGAIRMPEQNNIAGINSRFTFFRKLIWEVEGAFSLYTTNLGSGELKDVTDNSFLNSVNKVLVINQSSEYYSAIRSSLQYKAKSWSLKLEYRRIDPKYRSMGAYFFNNDIENLTVGPSFALYKRKLIFSGNIGLQRDNLKKTKKASSNRMIGNVNISFHPSTTFGFDVNYNNYSIHQKPGRLALNDSIKVGQTTQNLTLTPRLIFVNMKNSHLVMLVYSFLKFSDKNRFTSAFSEFSSHTTQLNYILGLIKSKLSITFGITNTILNSYAGSSTGIGGNTGISKTLWKDRMTLNWNASLMRNVYFNDGGWIVNSNFICNIKIHDHHSLRACMYYTGNYPDADNPNLSFNEYKGDISYIFTF